MLKERVFRLECMDSQQIHATMYVCGSSYNSSYCNAQTVWHAQQLQAHDHFATLGIFPQASALLQ